MCSNPITHNTPAGTVTFACRCCNECISARKNDWVARTMAEAVVTPHLFALELTYRNHDDGTEPDAAMAFKYEDVIKFNKRIRRAYEKHYKKTGEIKFIVAGERGSKKGRVHWHLVFMSKRPIQALGQWMDFGFKPLSEPILSKPRQKATMLQWSMWPHGHVVAKEPTQEGVAYVLKYALKDQFNVVKSKGTMREHKSENSGAGMFRMSKQPPVGLGYLEQKTAEWEEKLTLPVSLKLNIPNYSGYWWPKGKMREYLIERLWQINQKHIEKYGKDAPQYRTLLTSVESKNLTNDDWETLIYGPQEQIVETFDPWKLQEHSGHPDAEIRKRCGGAKVCRACFSGMGTATKADYRAWYAEKVRCYVTDTKSPPGWSFDHWWRNKRTVNPFCGLKDVPEFKSAFE